MDFIEATKFKITNDVGMNYMKVLRNGQIFLKKNRTAP